MSVSVGTQLVEGGRWAGHSQRSLLGTAWTTASSSVGEIPELIVHLCLQEKSEGWWEGGVT